MPSRAFLLSCLLLVGAALSYLVGNASAPLFDRDEPRYALTSRNMLASGDYVVPRQYDEPRFAKPPLIYWAQAASMRLLGNTGEFAARLPSSVAMWLVVLLLLLFLRRETDATTALLATAIFAFSALTLFLAKVCITDAVLLLSVAVSMFCLYRLWRGDQGWVIYLTLGLATGIGGLTKGPVLLGIQGTTLAVLWLMTRLDRRFPARSPVGTFDFPPAARTYTTPRWVKVLVAVGVVAVVALPWVILVEKNSPGFLTQAFRHDVVRRSTTGVDGQARPPGFYLLTLFGTFFPWSLFIPATLLIAWRNRHRPLTRFCLAACIGPWLMFEAVTSKMVHWFLPVFVPLSILTADAIMRCWQGKYQDLTDRPFRIAVAVWAGVVGLVGLVPWVLLVVDPSIAWWTLAPITLWAGGLAFVGYRLMVRARLPQAVGAMAAFMAVLLPIVFSVSVPRWPFMTLGREVGQALAAVTPPDAAPGYALLTGFKEPSAAYYQGGTAREARRRGSPNLLVTESGPPFVAAVQTDHWSWTELTPEQQARWEVVSRHKGVAYADSENVIEVLIVRRRGAIP